MQRRWDKAMTKISATNSSRAATSLARSSGANSSESGGITTELSSSPQASDRLNSDRLNGDRPGTDRLDSVAGDLALADLPQHLVDTAVNATPNPAATVAPAHLQRVHDVKLDVDNASGIAALGDGRFIVVDDEKGIYLADKKGHSDKLVSSKKDHALTDLEGVCLSPDGESILSLSERSGTLMRFSLKHKKHGKIKLTDGEIVGQLPKISRVHNKGWEGLTVLPGRFTPDGQPRLLAVSERSPRRLGVFSYPDLQQESLLKIPKDAKKQLSDMSDIAVCPQTGRVFVLSDESQSLVEFELNLRQQNAPGALLDTSELKMIGAHKLDFKREEKTEGLSFDGAGRLYIATDQRNRLVAYDVTRDKN